MQFSFIMDFRANLAVWASFAEQEDIPAIELMLYGPTLDDFKDAKERKRVLEGSGRQISAVGLWATGLTDPEKGEGSDVLKAGIEYSAELGARHFFTGAGEFGDPSGAASPEAGTADPVKRLADIYPYWKKYVEERGMKLSVYLGHKGSFIFSEPVLAEAYRRIPDLGLKLDPVGIIRNLKADPYDVVHRYGDKLIYFHVKGLLQLSSGELEPPPGMDDLHWGHFFAILHRLGYNDYISIEPHGPFWAKVDERRKRYIQLSVKNLSQYML